MTKYDDEHGLTRDYDALVHPSQVFDRPADVVNDPDLSLNEKRAILAAWASDACAIEAAPALRQSRTGHVVQFDDIMDALRTLDRQAFAAQQTRRPMSPTSRAIDRRRMGGNGNHGAPLH
jgi:hypothetical protein